MERAGRADRRAARHALASYIITRPPSTARTWPVMKAASSETRKATAAATSSVVPKRPSGVRVDELVLQGLGQVLGELGQDEAGSHGVAR